MNFNKPPQQFPSNKENGENPQERVVFNPDEFMDSVGAMEDMLDWNKQKLDAIKNALQNTEKIKEEFEEGFLVPVGKTPEDNKVSDEEYDAEFEAASYPARLKMLNILKAKILKLQNDYDELLSKCEDIEKNIQILTSIEETKMHDNPHHMDIFSKN